LVKGISDVQHFQRTCNLLIVASLAVVAVFVYMPFVSDYAFWFMVAAYVMLAGYRPPPK